MTIKLPEWRVDLPEVQRRASLREDIDRWIRSPELASLAATFGATAPALATEDLLAWYDQRSLELWDYRAGKERNLAETPNLSLRETDAALEAATALGLSEARKPSRGSYDFTLILGGLVRACVTRPRYARELANTGTSLGCVVALGGFRPLGGDEIALADQLDIHASNEFGAMDAGVRRSFDILGDPNITVGDGSEGNSDWRVHDYSQPRCSVVAAPSSDPQVRRANSGDTFIWWGNRTPNLLGAHVLLITNPIYVPYQGAAATQLLAKRFGIQVETVGISREAAGLGSDTQSFTAANYLQEIRSGIRGMQALYLESFR